MAAHNAVTLIRSVTTPEIQDELSAGTLKEFWNVLPTDQYDGEMIPRSRRVPLERVEHEAKRMRLRRSTPIVVYCNGPDCTPSLNAAEILVRHGFTNVRAYEGGILAWRDAGLTVARDLFVGPRSGQAPVAATMG